MKTTRLFLIAIALGLAGSVSAQAWNADVSNSKITWIGKKVTGQHDGTIQLKSGELKMNGKEEITGGEFIIDMNSIKCTDLTDAGTNAKLVGHLKSDDFFGVSSYPEAKLVITEKAAFSNNTATINADLTIKGITHPVTFDVKREGNMFVAEIVVDRSKYNVRYGSGSFFSNLGNNLIYDEFTIGVTLVGE